MVKKIDIRGIKIRAMPLKISLYEYLIEYVINELPKIKKAVRQCALLFILLFQNYLTKENAFLSGTNKTATVTTLQHVCISITGREL